MPEEFTGMREKQGCRYMKGFSCALIDSDDRNTKGRAFQMRDQGQQRYKAQSILGAVYDEQTHLVRLENICKDWLVTNLQEDWVKGSGQQCQVKGITENEEPTKICGEVNEMQQ